MPAAPVAALLGELSRACRASPAAGWTEPFDALLFGRGQPAGSAGSPAAGLADAAYDLRCVAGEPRRAEALEAGGARLLEQGGAAAAALRCLLALRAVTLEAAPDDRAGSGRFALALGQATGRPGFQHFSAALFDTEPRQPRAAAVDLGQLMGLLEQPPKFQVAAALGLSPPPQPKRPPPPPRPRPPPSPSKACGALGTVGAEQSEHSRTVRRSVCWETARSRSTCSVAVRANHTVSTEGAASCLHAQRLGSPALYFTEEGVAAFHRACCLCDLQPGASPDHSVICAPKSATDSLDLVCACAAVMQGFRSSPFEFCEEGQSFVWTGTTGGSELRTMCSRRALAVSMRQVADAGTCCARIEHLAGALGDREHMRGLVRRQVGRALGAYLSHIRAWFADSGARPDGAAAATTLISLLRRTRGMRAQLSQVCSLCGWPIEAASPNLPYGLDLLNRLHNAAEVCEASPQRNARAPASWSQVVYVIFCEALQPFLRFADAWLRHGVVEDPFDEFADRAFLATAAANTDLGHLHSSSPRFLTLRAWNQLLRCGATVQLVHRYDPSHYLCQTSAPALSLGAALTTMEWRENFMPDEFDGTWSWLRYCERRRQLWVEMLQVAAEKRELQIQKALASQSQQTISDTVRAIRGAAAQAAAANLATAEHLREQRMLYAEELRRQMMADRRKADAENEEDSTKSGVDSFFSDVFPDDVQMVKQMIEEEYAAKIDAVEARLGRLSWQQRRMRLQQARLRFWRREAESERHTLLLRSRTTVNSDIASAEYTVEQPKESGSGDVQSAEIESHPADTDQPTAGSDGNPDVTRAANVEEERPVINAVQVISSSEASMLHTRPSGGHDAVAHGTIPHADHGQDGLNSTVDAVAASTAIPNVAIRNGTIPHAAPRLVVPWSADMTGEPKSEHSHGIASAVWSTTAAQTIVPLSVILRHCLQRTIEEQDRQAQVATTRIFLRQTELDLLQHLRNLREFYLTGSPDFAAALSSSIFAGVESANRDWLTAQNCAAALSGAFAASGAADHVASLFSVQVVAKKPCSSKPRGDNDLHALDGCGVQLLYAPAAAWPLDSVLDSDSMHHYNDLWRMLMQVHRMLGAGSMLWSLLKGIAQVQGRFTAGQINRLSLIRHDVQHFINVLQDYFMTQVLHVQWAHLERELEESLNLGQIRDVHRRYLDRLLSGCLLRSSSAGTLKVIFSMFDLVLTFRAQLVVAERHHRSTADDAAAAGRSFHEMSRTGELFRKHAEFLTRLLRKQVEAAPSNVIRVQAEDLLRRLEV